MLGSHLRHYSKMEIYNTIASGLTCHCNGIYTSAVISHLTQVPCIILTRTDRVVDIRLRDDWQYVQVQGINYAIATILVGESSRMCTFSSVLHTLPSVWQLLSANSYCFLNSSNRCGCHCEHVVGSNLVAALVFHN